MRSSHASIASILHLHVHLQFDSAEQDGKDEAKANLEKAQAKSDLYKGRAEEIDKKSTPKVEVITQA